MHSIKMSFCALLVTCLPCAGFAQGQMNALFEALKIGPLIEVMRDEGLGYGDDLAADLFPGRGLDGWRKSVSAIYDLDRMDQIVTSTMSEVLADTDLDPLLTFFNSDLGQEIVLLELNARIAFLDNAVEEAAKAQMQSMAEAEDPRFDLIETFTLENDLIETNVVGAMNANYAFYLGLASDPAAGFDLSEEDMLTDVWSQEPDIRQSTIEWVYSYLTMAYQPLSDAELTQYLDLTLTEEGRDLTRALFEGFDDMFVGISQALGVAASQFMAGQDL
ncbi:hypothetical protein [Algirhabdus cladophorae]|uniref:hypothetical protein n=1 Tax=Algirhabdus cladophorae TaxID=3377108 RepID=UPI003B847A74